MGNEKRDAMVFVLLDIATIGYVVPEDRRRQAVAFSDLAESIFCNQGERLADMICREPEGSIALKGAGIFLVWKNTDGAMQMDIVGPLTEVYPRAVMAAQEYLERHGFFTIRPLV